MLYITTEKGGHIMYVVIFIVGVAIGFLLQSTLMAKHIKGELRIKRDEDGSYLFVELGTTVERLSEHKFVTFKVNTQDWASLN